MVPRTSKDESYSRVKYQSINDHSKSSMWTKFKSNNEISTCTTVKFACGGSAVGYIYPIVILVSRLSDVEMPNNNFIVVPVEGMKINFHVDLINKEWHLRRSSDSIVT